MACVQRCNSKNITEERLIELVKTSPVLYDPAHKKYTDSTLKTDVWDAIAKQLKIKDATTCKFKWNALRDTYRRHLRRNQTRQAQGKKPIIYKYSEQFQFLASQYEKSDEDVTIIEESEVKVKREKPDSDREDEVKVKAETWFDRAIKAELEPLEEPDSEFVEPETEPVSSSVAGGQAVDLFLAGLAPVLKALPPHALALAKADLFAVAHRYEMRSLAAPPHGPCCRCPDIPPTDMMNT